ncbi:hypothetical protein LSH36_275g09020 [Paralvinella palmiformis]|uniref:Choline/ethanolamine kinase n=1 Tax=Paralvinella palmiformis TaxID=53620 RepID=A0AAD9N4P0_9ANNE|nr:hypothetical protein LSH36_275g09020 [Paralvinella palmiformis]
MAELDITPEMRKRGLMLCRQFLGRTWTKIEDEDFEIERISGGLSNLLYLCSLSDKVCTNEGEQRKIMLRVYGKIIRDHPEIVVTDSVIFALLAEKNMGPKLFGVFTGGRVEEYIKSRHLTTLELHDPDISALCAKVMGRFHQLVMPLVKQPRWLFDIMQRYLDEALHIINTNNSIPAKNDKLQKVFSFDLKEELVILKRILSQVDSPVVFCHNDMQEGNLLLPDDNLQKRARRDWHLVIIDFEYSQYNFRGFDLGNHFCEWCYDYSIKEAPYYSAVISNYPSRDQQLHFIRAYLEENPPDGDYDPAEVEEHMILEANTFALASHFMWGLWSIVQSHKSDIPFGYLDYALDRFDAYYYQKKNLPNHLQVNGV